MEYAGCKAVLEPGPVCVLASKREVRLWVGAVPDAQIEIQVDGRQTDAAEEDVREGQTFSLIMPPGGKRVDVIADTPEGQASWFLPLTEPESVEPGHEATQKRSRDVLSEIQQKMLEVDKNIRDRNLAAVRETLAGVQIPLKAPAESRCLVSYYRSLLAEREGDYRTAMAEIQKAVGIAERVKLNLHLWMFKEQLAILLRSVGRSRESAEIFDHLARTPHSSDSCEEAQLLNNQAWSRLLGREAGESLEDPTNLLEKALAAYESCAEAKPEQKVNVLINLALSHLQGGRLAPAKALLARAHELEPHPPLPHALWWIDLEARIALLEGQSEEALHRFAKLEELAFATASSDGRLRAAFGRARSQEALGERTAALETLTQTEALLDEQSLQVPLYEGRETFIGTRQAVVSLHVELLLQEGRAMEALTVARHGRSRMLRQLERSDRLASLTPEQQEQWERLHADYEEKRAALEERARDDWKLPEDQLRHEQAARRAEAEAMKAILDQAFLVLGDPGPRQSDAPSAPPRSGELVLAYYPVSHGWVGFAADRESVTVHRFELASDTEELARRLLMPFRALIKKANRIRILPSGPLQAVDFHALPFDGRPLLATAPVVYGLDLPGSTVPAQPPGRHALLVANPRDDLPGTLGEVRAVRQVLESESQPWITEELKNAQASAKAVREGLTTADLLHYAGHGNFSGFGGWESGLLLAEEGRLTLGDLLALDRVPAWVVLSACYTGSSSTEVPIESLGLAHAFLLAGSREVIASTRRADDRAVPQFFTDLYRRWDRQPDLAVALQRAQLAWHQRNPGADWASFRLFEP